MLAEGDGGAARLTQLPMLALIEQFAEAERLTQLPMLALVEQQLEQRLTQLPVLALVEHIPCLTRWAQCWKITRVDGEVLAFTSLDRDLVFRGVTHKRCDSLNASAAELSAALGSVGNLELAGIISDDAITEADLFGGVYDNAQVEVWMVPWDAEQGEVAWRIGIGTCGNLSQGDLGFNMEVLTPGARMQQQALVQVYTPACRFELGDARCTVNLAPLTVTGSVTGVPAEDASTQKSRREFTDTSRSEANGYFDGGMLTWTSGANDGAQSEVKSFAADSFILWQPMLYPIQAGDSYSLVPGCDKLAATCKAKFSNYDNFGGFPDVPGRDEISKTPDAKN